MTDLKMTLRDWLVQGISALDEDFLASGAKMLAEGLMELEVSDKVGAERYERSGERENYRNGYRSRLWQTRVGDIALRVPKLRSGGYTGVDPVWWRVEDFVAERSDDASQKRTLPRRVPRSDP